MHSAELEECFVLSNRHSPVSLVDLFWILCSLIFLKIMYDSESGGAWRCVVGRELSGVSEYREAIKVQSKAIKSYWSACSWRRRRRNPSKRRELLARHSVASHNTWILNTAVRTYNLASAAVGCCSPERTEVVAYLSRYLDRYKCNYPLPRCAHPLYLIINNVSSLVCEPYILLYKLCGSSLHNVFPSSCGWAG